MFCFEYGFFVISHTPLACMAKKRSRQRPRQINDQNAAAMKLVEPSVEESLGKIDGCR